MIYRYLIIIFFFCTSLMASITDELLKLSDLYKAGLLTEAEFKKAKSILLEINEITEKEKKVSTELNNKKKKVLKKITKKDKSSPKKDSNIKVERIYGAVSSKFTNKAYEKMKLTVGDYQIYTHRPGAVKIKQISNNKQLAIIGDKLQYKYYNNGKDFFQINVNKKDKELNLTLNGVKVLIWKGQYVQEAEATFYQILAMGRLPFHYYVKLDTAELAFALNIENFTRKIELAVDRTKEDLAQQYNLSVDQIDTIIEENDMIAASKFIKSPSDSLQQDLSKKKKKLYSDLKDSIGSDKYSKVIDGVETDLDKTLEGTITKEIKVAVDESIKEAINSGIEAAALEAGIMALIDALLSGASWADALKAGEQACASSGGC